MAKRLQHRGGTTSQHSTFTGAVREVTVDTDKNTLVVHDGATAGGHPLATATNFTSTGIDDNATSTAITIDSSERVGIGITPAYPLDVNGKDTNVSENVLRLTSRPNSAGEYVGMLFDNNANGVSAIRSVNGAPIYKTNLAFYTSSLGSTTEKMRITNSGNVGIGTSSPLRKLEVSEAGASYFRVADTTNSVNVDVISASSGGFIGTASSDPFIFQTTNTERMRITSAGKILVNTTGEYAGTGAEMTVNDGIDVGTTSTANGGFVTFIGDGVGKIGEVGSKVGGYSTMPNIEFHADNVSGGSQAGHIEFNTKFNNASRSEAFRIASNGDLMSGGTSRVSPEGIGLYIENAGGNDGAIIELKHLRNAGASRDFLRFFNNADGEAGAIVHSGETSVTYATSSDYRLKENVSYDFDATTRLKQLRPARFNFIAEPEKIVDGFIAHEVQDIVPEAITGEKDAINAKGKPSYQGIDQSKLVPLLVKTIQELEARITTLEANNP